MRRRTPALITLAVAAVAAGIAVPVLAFSGQSAPAAAASPIADAPGSGQSVVDWNKRLVTILGTTGAQPATIHPTRSLAMLQAAEYNAVVSITHGTAPYHAAVPAAADARPDVAADQAAHDVLAALYPAMRAGLNTQLANELAALPAGTPTQDGIQVGAAAAKQVVGLRSADGSTATAPAFTAGGQPGDYRPTPPKFGAPMFRTWGAVTPFVVPSAQQFRPVIPPAVTSAEYATALDEVRSLGRATSTTRTPDETVSGKFWSSTPIWITWNQVTQQLTLDRHASLADTTPAGRAREGTGDRPGERCGGRRGPPPDRPERARRHPARRRRARPVPDLPVRTGPVTPSPISRCVPRAGHRLVNVSGVPVGIRGRRCARPATLEVPDAVPAPITPVR